MLASILAALALAATCLSSSLSNNNPAYPLPNRYPRRTIAGVSVPDTPLIRAAQVYAQSHADDEVYRHIMRSWLFGNLMLSHNATLAATVDAEVHAVAIILHDLGWDQTPNSSVVSHDRRFEVDGAIGARDFIRSHAWGRDWEERRVQLVWDAIALHNEPMIGHYKEPEVVVVRDSIILDFAGPALGMRFGITEEEYAAVVEELPNDGLVSGTVDALTWLCRTKPETTYDTFLQPYGERFVEGYSAAGHRAIDFLLGSTEVGDALVGTAG